MKRIYLSVMALLLIMGSWGWNIWYFQSMQLSAPLFLKHDISLNGNDGHMINLYFLENKNSSKKVMQIQVEELPELRFQVHEGMPYSHQALNMAYAEWRPDQTYGAGDQTSLVIQEVTVFYDKGGAEKLPIGSINIEWRDKKGIVASTGGSASSIGEGSVHMRMTQAADLDRADVSFSAEAKRWLTVRLSGVPIENIDFPLELSEGEGLSFEYEWTIPGENAVFGVYDSDLLLYFKTEGGQPAIESARINRSASFTESELKRLVRSGGELH